jgi:oligopeptidase B
MKALTPPQTVQKPQTFTLHGDVRTDEYAWLQDRESPQVRAYLAAENAYADALLKPHVKMQRRLYAEMKARMREDDLSVPVKDGPYLYYTRVQKGKQYAIHCRAPYDTNKTVGPVSSGQRRLRGEEVILDENVLAKGQKFFALGAAEVSSDHRLLAYSTDVAGDEKHTLYVKDLATGKLLKDQIESVGDVEWSEDSRYLFYTKEQHPHPPRQLFRHELGTSTTRDVLVYEEKDVQWYVGLGKTRDRKFIIVSGGTFDMTETRIISADAPLSNPVLVASRQPHVKYGVEHHDGFLYIITNERAVEYKIMRTPAATPERKHWTVWLSHDPKRTVEGVLPFKDFLVLVLREDGFERAYITDPEQRRMRRVAVPAREATVSVWDDIEYESPSIRVTYESMIAPKVVADYNVRTRKFIVRKRQIVPRYDATKYETKRVWITHDDVRIPVTLAYRKGLKRDGKAPLLLYAYGSYGITTDPSFSITRIPLLERGWVAAIAAPRGGGEMGQRWHEVAKKMTKHRTYEDVIACAEHLVRGKWTSPARMVLTGGSAGGMLVGAVLNMRPDLFGAAIAYVPAADTLTSMLDTSLGGTRLHYDEIGDPHDPKQYRYIRKWSPYEGVRARAYPRTLVRCSMFDIRTPYWESAKWAARLRAKSTSGNPVLLKTEMSAGHFGKSGRYEWLKERAYDYSFLSCLFPPTL